MSYRKAGPADIETFKEDIAENVKHCIKHVELIDNEASQNYVLSLCEFYEEKGYLSQAQLTYLVPYWQDINKRL
jgi:hypothetical protein